VKGYRNPSSASRALKTEIWPQISGKGNKTKNQGKNEKKRGKRKGSGPAEPNEKPLTLENWGAGKEQCSCPAKKIHTIVTVAWTGPFLMRDMSLPHGKPGAAESAANRVKKNPHPPNHGPFRPAEKNTRHKRGLDNQ